MKNSPEKIFLQVGDDCDASDFKELAIDQVSWNEERIFENDIEYTLSSSVNEQDRIIGYLTRKQAYYDEVEKNKKA